MIKRLAKWLLKDEHSVYDLMLRLEKRITVCERNMKFIQRIESKCDSNQRQHDILQSKFVSLLNKVNGKLIDDQA